VWVNYNNAAVRVFVDQLTVKQNFYQLTLAIAGRGDDISVFSEGV